MARMHPLADSELDDEQREVLRPILARGGTAVAIFRTLARRPRLLRRWSDFGGHLLYRGELPPRVREILVLRTAWNCRAEYDWGQHVLAGMKSGLSAEEIALLAGSGTLSGEGERGIVELADELHSTSTVSEALWERLAGQWSEGQLLEALLVVGQYHLVSYVTNAVGIEREPGVPGLPAG